MFHIFSRLISAAYVKMESPLVCKILTLVFIISGICGELEVLNDVTDRATEELNLPGENLLPVIPVHQNFNKGKQQRSLSSFEDKKNTTLLPIEIKKEHQPDIAKALTGKANPQKVAEAKVTTSQNSQTNSASTPFKNEDEIDLASEGLIQAEPTKVKQSPAGRKLSEFVESFPSQSSEDRALPISDSRSFVESDFGLGDAVEKKGWNMKVACLYEDSWECLMLKQDALALQEDANLSHSSALERVKRQSSSQYQVNAVFNSGNSRSLLLDCEGGECGSGTTPSEDTTTPSTTPTDNSTETKAVDLCFNHSTTIQNVNRYTNMELTNSTRTNLARELETQLTPIYSHLPGFKRVFVDPIKVYVRDDTLVFYEWTVCLDGGNDNFTDKNRTEVENLIKDLLQGANDQYKNITVNGQKPIDDFNSTQAADQIGDKAENPCNIKPSPCSVGYGSCTKLTPDETPLPGVRVQCTDNCLNNYNCRNGKCFKDKVGQPFCSCNAGWAGLTCSEKNDTDSPADTDKIELPDMTIDLTATIPTSLRPQDLTPDKRREIAKNLTQQLQDIFKDFPGMTGIKVDPNTIRIENGQLIVPWDLSYNLGSSAFTGKSDAEILDLIRQALLNASDAYKGTINIDGRRPVDDFDFVDAIDQVIGQLNNPCLKNPCGLGYGHCQVLNVSSHLVKCVHNCNALPTPCMNGGTCQLNITGHAVCQCTSGYEGKTCQQKLSSTQMDAGQTTGIVLGSLLVAAGVIGSCFWFFLCARKGQKDINFSHYSDDEGSGRSSGSTPKPFYFERPQVSLAPMHPFNSIYGGGSPYGNFSPESSYGSDGSQSTSPRPFSQA